MQELVKLHGGAIAVTSAPGKGTAFTVRIPTGSAHLPKDRIAAPRAAASTAIGAAPFVEEALRWLPGLPDGAAQAWNGLTETEPHIQRSQLNADRAPRGKVLFADDNADMRDYVRRLLAGLYDVETVAEGESALRAARERTPDLIVADIMMPGMDGLELLRVLRADSRASQIPVILLSARAGEESKVEGLAAGADDYLVKPFTARELLARVSSHLHLAQERQRFAQAARLAELEKANSELRDARRAALNVLEDAVEARERAELLYRELRASEKRLNEITGQATVAPKPRNGKSA